MPSTRPSNGFRHLMPRLEVGLFGCYANRIMQNLSSFGRVAGGISLLWGLFSFAVDPSAPNAKEVPVNPAAKAEPSVFDSPKNDAPKTSRSALTGADRFVGEEPDYNTEQRAEWLKTCEPLKSSDLKAYRECFENEKRKTTAQVRKSFDDSQRRQGPTRGTSSALPLMEDRPEPREKD